ncbi:putative WD repeat-containing protein like [Verticillium longisporum]|uniref:Putative WD repeat-containing protein like n=1 Tax=Verticillium longisporum TaxID=100787 RepID=A0A8I3AE82_VERLO|nr:putative WD repeat-containing protein like [Verticillium longisporum]
MYMLAPVAGHRFTGREEVYVLDIHRLGAGLASITSDQQLSLFDPARLGAGPITSLPTAHGNIKALRPFDRSASTVCTAGDDGASSIALWDVRGASPAQRARYAEVHSDDVTELCFHPAEAPGILLSGSTDGVVNVYDTRAADEDDVVVQTLNTGSVHHAAFMSASEVYTLTHDEKLAVFNLDAAYEEGTPVADFGDVRAELACQYVANVTAKVDGSGAIIGVGSQDRQNFQLVHLARGSEKNSWVFDQASSVGLPGGHGEEIVRAFCFYDDEQVVFTAGEDGNIKAWRPN